MGGPCEDRQGWTSGVVWLRLLPGAVAAAIWLGAAPGEPGALDAGTRHHAHKAVTERVAGGSTGLGRVILAVGVLVLLLVLLGLLWR